MVLVLLTCLWFRSINVTYQFSFQQSWITEPVEETSRKMILFKFSICFLSVLSHSIVCNYLDLTRLLSLCLFLWNDIQLRRVCRIAGVQVSIEPTNTRDSFYRTSVDFVLNACSRCLTLY